LLFFSPPARAGDAMLFYHSPPEKFIRTRWRSEEHTSELQSQFPRRRFAPRQRIGNTTMKKMFAALLVSAGLLSGGIAAAQDAAAPAPAPAAPAAAAPAPKAHHAKHHHKKHHAKKTAHKAKKHSHKKKAKA